jgi:predicted nucleic acid-binding protein
MIILDASFIIKIILEERYSDIASNLLKEFIRDGERITSIDIALAEILNTLWKHHILIGDIDDDKLYESYNDAMNLWRYIEVIRTDEVAELAIDIATKNKLSIYDSLYIGSAIKYNAGLATFDRVMRRVGGKLGVNIYPKKL